MAKFKITGLHGDGDGGKGANVFDGIVDGREVVIAAARGQLEVGNEYDEKITLIGMDWHNGHFVDYIVAPRG